MAADDRDHISVVQAWIADVDALSPTQRAMIEGFGGLGVDRTQNCSVRVNNVLQGKWWCIGVGISYFKTNIANPRLDLDCASLLIEKSNPADQKHCTAREGWNHRPDRRVVFHSSPRVTSPGSKIQLVSRWLSMTFHDWKVGENKRCTWCGHFWVPGVSRRGGAAWWSPKHGVLIGDVVFWSKKKGMLRDAGVR